jgi:hypothetical protein
VLVVVLTMHQPYILCAHFLLRQPFQTNLPIPSLPLYQQALLILLQHQQLGHHAHLLNVEMTFAQNNSMQGVLKFNENK